MYNARIAVIVPTYKKNLNKYDEFSFQRTIEIFSKRNIFIVCGDNLDAYEYTQISPSIKIERFNDDYFKSKDTYNKLCLSRELYARFAKDYDYILICQLDALALQDKLDDWTMLDYDYVGAPWCHLCAFKNKCMSQPGINVEPKENYVGNGGFSLRRISSFMKLAEIVDYKGGPEDVEISKHKELKFPSCRQASQFSIEFCAPYFLEQGIIPIGTHNMVMLYPNLCTIKLTNRQS